MALSYRDAFIFIAVFLIASMSLILMLLHPGLCPAWGFAALTRLPVASTAFTGWVVLRAEGNEDTARD